MPADTSSVTVEPGFSFTRAFGSCPMQRSRRHLRADLRQLVRPQPGAAEGVDRVAELEAREPRAPRRAPAPSRSCSCRSRGRSRSWTCVVAVVSGGVSDTATALPRGTRVPASGTWRAIGVPAEPCAVTWPSCSPAARSFATARSTVSPTIVGTSRPRVPDGERQRDRRARAPRAFPRRGDCAITLPGVGPLPSQPVHRSHRQPDPCRRAAAIASVLLPCTSGTATRGSGRRRSRAAALREQRRRSRSRAGSAAPPPTAARAGVWRNTASKRSSRAPGTRGVATISMRWSTARPSRRGRSACTVSAVPARRPGEAGKLGVSTSTRHAPSRVGAVHVDHDRVAGRAAHHQRELGAAADRSATSGRSSPVSTWMPAGRRARGRYRLGRRVPARAGRFGAVPVRGWLRLRLRLGGGGRLGNGLGLGIGSGATWGATAAAARVA